jgi:uncharacterized membrane protein YgdD (TMEM256/DUF423 family)
MEHQSLLETIAQVAATFAGFAAIIGVFQGAERGTESVIRVRDVVEASIIVTLLAFVPFLVEGYGAGEVLVWKISSVIALLMLALGLSGSMIRSWNVWRKEPAILVTAVSIVIGGWAYVGLAVFGPLAADMAFLFLLIGTLGFAGFLFVYVLTPRAERD